MNVVPLNGRMVDLGLGIQDDRAVRRHPVQVTAVSLVILVLGRSKQRLGVKRQQQIHLFHM